MVFILADTLELSKKLYSQYTRYNASVDKQYMHICILLILFFAECQQYNSHRNCKISKGRKARLIECIFIFTFFMAMLSGL